MQVIHNPKDLKQFLAQNENMPGCFADTGFLYAAVYLDDRLYEKAQEVFEILADYDIKIFVNVISRMEFIDLIFRKQITLGAIQMYKALSTASPQKNLFNLLKNIRDEDTAQRSSGQSYKINESRLKKLREQIELAVGQGHWKEFCKQYAGRMLTNEWEIVEQELGLNFIEVLEGGISEIIDQPLHWSDMVQVMGEQGLRGPDAMIANLFLKSRLPLLITTDKDITRTFDDEDPLHDSKTILHLKN